MRSPDPCPPVHFVVNRHRDIFHIFTVSQSTGIAAKTCRAGGLAKAENTKSTERKTKSGTLDDWRDTVRLYVLNPGDGCVLASLSLFRSRDARPSNLHSLEQPQLGQVPIVCPINISWIRTSCSFWELPVSTHLLAPTFLGKISPKQI